MKKIKRIDEVKKMGKVRLADIAKKVGVSTVTVYNALAGNKGVSEELREKIQSVASEIGHRSHRRIRLCGLLCQKPLPA